MAAAATLPSVNGEACVHALAPHASCHACVSACPQGAWLLDEDGLSLDTSRCDGCGLCVPACPRAALALPLAPAILRDHRGSGTAFAACERAPAREIAPIPCLNAIGTRDLDRLAEDTVHTLHVLSGACDTCPRGGGPASLTRAAALHRHVRASNGLDAIVVECLDAPTFARRYRRAREDSEVIHTGRRKLFGALLARPPAAQPALHAVPFAYAAPVLDAARCVACDACALICPDGALSLRPGPEPAYVARPSACTACGLCVDVCDQQAVSLVQPAKAAEIVTELDPCRCAACGAAYHAASGASRARGALCRICTQTQHHKKLFQVFKEA